MASRVMGALRRVFGPEEGETSRAAAGTPSAKARKRLQERVTAGLLFGLVGMITGTLSLYVAWNTTRQEEAVVLSAFPTASPADLTHAGLGIRVQIANKSLRPVIIRNASLWVDGSRVSKATGYLNEIGILDRSAVDPAEITDSRLDFPISLNEREGRSLAILMDVWRPIVGANATPASAAIARHALNQFLTSVASLATGGKHRIELGLELAPGGFHKFRIRGLVEPAIYPEAIRDASAIQRRAPLQNWLVTPQVEGRKLLGLALRRRFAGAGQVDLVRLDVWKERSLYHRAFTRPVLGQQAELFPLPQLARGGYVATFRLGGQVIASRSFALPWRETHCELGKEGEPDWCAAAVRRKLR